jgi:hypothetical protein
MRRHGASITAAVPRLLCEAIAARMVLVMNSARTDVVTQARLAELALELVCAEADLRAIDFLRWLVRSGRNPEWDVRQSRPREVKAPPR